MKFCTFDGIVDTINTNCSNLNSRLTSTRAGYLDYLANSTYGLSAIKTAISKIPTTSGGGYLFGEVVDSTTSLGSEVTKTYDYPVFIIANCVKVSVGSSEVCNYSDMLILGPFKAGLSLKFIKVTGAVQCKLTIVKAVTG